MGLLSHQLAVESDPDESGAPLGLQPIRSFIGQPGGAVSGGERPAAVDTSREGNRPAGSGLITSWGKRSKGAAGAETKTPEAIQAGYEDLFQ